MMEKSSLPIWIRKKPFRVTLGGAVGRSCRNWGRAGKHHAVQCRLRWSQFCCNCVNRKKNVCCFHMIWFKKNILCISYPLILQKKKTAHLPPSTLPIFHNLPRGNEGTTSTTVPQSERYFKGCAELISLAGTGTSMVAGAPQVVG